jgi:hypothetical protein
MAQRINAFLAPMVAVCGPRPPVSPVPVPALCDAQEALQEADSKHRKEDLAVEKGINEVLAWAKVHRPKNTSQAYLPKQREWKVSFPTPFNSFLFILLYSSTTSLIHIYLQAWCETMDFRPRGEYLLFDWVDEGKLLLFVKTQVAERAPHKGKRVAAEKKRKLEKEAEAEDSKKRKRRRRQEAGTMAEAEDVLGEPEAPNGGDEEPKPGSLLMYNLVCSYVLAIMELWSHQVSEKLHSTLSPHNVAVKALKTSIARGQHQRYRAEFEDRRLSTIIDRYC